MMKPTPVIASRAGALTLAKSFAAINSAALPQLLWQGAVFGFAFWVSERAIVSLFQRAKSSVTVSASPTGQT